ncbi:hypothetical protein TPA4_43 [Tsukamurella phage TPA4]|uniref:hypothetical protein n=1 Tax=Tsukamurella phage TPA4 TaxID=1647476 RepID=UPI0007B62371|nr:hypothetical protein BH784_gp43 [Tsukamurella phage TPA4]AKJ72208.1 hypothetical protein TPA4_43 [Tsukamurella phage TPA4]
MILKSLTTVAAVAAVAACSAAPAAATPGLVTLGGNVAVIISTPGCASITWPKGYTHVECDTLTVIQGPITRGDTFGASVVSYTGSPVACRVIDITTGDVIWSDVALGGYTARCTRVANR